MDGDPMGITETNRAWRIIEKHMGVKPGKLTARERDKWEHFAEEMLVDINVELNIRCNNLEDELGRAYDLQEDLNKANREITKLKTALEERGEER